MGLIHPHTAVHLLINLDGMQIQHYGVKNQLFIRIQIQHHLQSGSYLFQLQLELINVYYKKYHPWKIS